MGPRAPCLDATLTSSLACCAAPAAFSPASKCDRPPACARWTRWTIRPGMEGCQGLSPTPARPALAPMPAPRTSFPTVAAPAWMTPSALPWPSVTPRSWAGCPTTASSSCRRPAPPTASVTSSGPATRPPNTQRPRSPRRVPASVKHTSMSAPSPRPDMAPTSPPTGHRRRTGNASRTPSAVIRWPNTGSLTALRHRTGSA